MAPVTVPIVCRLEAPGARAQLGEWQDLLAGEDVRLARLSPTEISIRLPASGVDEAGSNVTTVGSLVSLAQREKACCPFFTFRVDIDEDAVTLLVTVPEDAVAVLDELTRPER